jgi:hypothetical protein
LSIDCDTYVKIMSEEPDKQGHLTNRQLREYNKILLYRQDKNISGPCFASNDLWCAECDVDAWRDECETWPPSERREPYDMCRVVVRCPICGFPYPLWFYVSDKAWERHVPLELRKEDLCRECYDELKTGESLDVIKKRRRALLIEQRKI